MKKYSYLILFLLVSNFVFAQEVVNNDPMLVSTKKKNTESLDYEKIKGTPYLYSDFKSGFVYIKDKAPTKILVKYDLYMKEMEIIVNEVIYSFRKEMPFDSICIENQTFVYNSNWGNNAYFELLAKGSLSLLKDYKVEIFQPVSKNSYSYNVEPAFTKPVEVYYLLKNDKLTKIKLSKSDILSAMDDKKDLVEQYVSKNKLSLKKEDDAVKVINYYNNL